ncbi:conjugal transfer protein TrbD [uncultured Thiodictyon sp.]|uniref:conjugal transfer protein TrbD n=1 Tax=uncultured Thiodictyon sp. TaxID=1846217 RepID=UPI0025DAE84C|nr:conjugal transfer protein TrbD [uncultured Thiodictyon sp.]
MALRAIPIRRAGNRTILFMGGDRKMTMFAGVMAGALIFSAQDLRATIFGVLLWSVSLYLLRLMAKADPQMLQVYLRHRRYKRYYPARSTPFRENSPSQTRGYQ